MSEVAQPALPQAPVLAAPPQPDYKTMYEALLADQRKQAVKKPNAVTAGLSHVGAAVASAFTSPEVVKAEKSLAVLALTRLVITLGASAASVDVLLHAVGVK